MIKRKGLALLLMMGLILSLLSGCSSSTEEASDSNASQQESTTETSESTEASDSDQTGETIETATTSDGETVNEPVRAQEEKDPALAMHIGLLKGPTGMGAVMLMNESDNGFVFGNYDFQLYDAPDEVTAKLINGELDVAAVPVNLASTLYNKTDGGVKIAAINTLGTMFLVENGNTIESMEDLDGKTVMLSGQGAVPDYVFQYLLQESGVTNCTVEYATSHADLANQLAAGEVDLAVMPEPYVSIAMSKNADLRIAIELAEVWDQYSYEDSTVDNTLPMGCIVVRTAYLDEHEKEFKKFLDEYDNFIDEAKKDYHAAAEKCAEYGIVADAAVAEKAYPNCHICYIAGQKMTMMADYFLNVMYDENPQSIGGAVPESDFYYSR